MAKTLCTLTLLLALCGCATDRNSRETDVWRKYSQELGKVMNR